MSIKGGSRFHAIQAKQGARMCADRREHKPFGRSRWQAVVSLGMHVLVRARVECLVAILNFVLLASSRFPLAFRHRCLVYV